MKKIKTFFLGKKGRILEVALYIGSSLASTAVDWFIYLMMVNVFGIGVQISYSAGKILSGIANFLINNFVVFRQGGGIGLLKRGAGYCLTVILSLALGNLLLTLLHWTGLGEEISKLAADGICFFLNYFIQRTLVFNRK
ncbi:MAG: GtrA family protein [Clostridia bacterium]|nr:GtrA family protein [Clostridia bacterium]